MWSKLMKNKIDIKKWLNKSLLFILIFIPLLAMFTCTAYHAQAQGDVIEPPDPPRPVAYGITADQKIVIVDIETGSTTDYINLNTTNSTFDILYLNGEIYITTSTPTRNPSGVVSRVDIDTGNLTDIYTSPSTDSVRGIFHYNDNTYIIRGRRTSGSSWTFYNINLVNGSITSTLPSFSATTFTLYRAATINNNVYYTFNGSSSIARSLGKLTNLTNARPTYPISNLGFINGVLFEYNNNLYILDIRVTDSLYIVDLMNNTISDTNVDIDIRGISSGPLFTFSDITTGSAIIQWNQGTNADGYLFEWREQGQSSWLQEIVYEDQRPAGVQLIDLKGDTTYEVRVASTRQGAENSAYTAIESFTTEVLPPADVPTGIAITDKKMTELDLTWDSANNADGYGIR